MELPERVTIRLDVFERDLENFRSDLKDKADKDDLDRLDTRLTGWIEDRKDKLVTKEQLDNTKAEIQLNIDHRQKGMEAEMRSLRTVLDSKVSNNEFHPMKVMFGTTVTIFSGYILTQLARIFFGGV